MTIESGQQPTAGDTAADMPVLKRPYCEILDDCKGTFVDCLQPTGELFDYLTERQVLNKEMVQKIKCRPNRADKVRALFEFLQALGPKSFLSFVKALERTENTFLANILSANIVSS